MFLQQSPVGGPKTLVPRLWTSIRCGLELFFLKYLQWLAPPSSGIVSSLFVLLLVYVNVDVGVVVELVLVYFVVGVVGLVYGMVLLLMMVLLVLLLTYVVCCCWCCCCC